MKTITGEVRPPIGSRRSRGYGLTKERDEDGYFHLWKLAGKNSYDAGLVADPENLEWAIDEAEEEMYWLRESARQEFGW